MPGPIPVSVIIPAYNAAGTLALTLEALVDAMPAPYEILVVDDGSTDETVRIAREQGARVLSLPENRGAAAAKNCGAQAAKGDVLLFTDADVVPARDAIGRVQAALADGKRDGVVGVLDEDIPARNWASQFKNLWMRYTYLRLAGAARIGLFYTSAAAIRRARFLELGGFDERYRGASIAEDTEFGQRAWGAGLELQLDPALCVVHLKAYGTQSVLREDFWRARALTLMRLRKRGQPFFTSVPAFYQLAVPVMYLTLLLALAALLTGSALGVALTVAALAVFYLLNLPLLSFLLRRRGLRFALQSAMFLPLDVLVVGAGMARAGMDAARGRMY